MFYLDLNCHHFIFDITVLHFMLLYVEESLYRGTIPFTRKLLLALWLYAPFLIGWDH